MVSIGTAECVFASLRVHFFESGINEDENDDEMLGILLINGGIKAFLISLMLVPR